MSDPLFWLGLSLLLVAVSLTAVLVALLPTLRELSRAARSAEKLFDTLSRELPPTLESIRLTGLELTDLTDDVSEGVQSAGRMVKQVDQSLLGVQQQAKKAQRVTRSLAVGLQAAWQTLLKPSPTPTKTARSRRTAPSRLAEDYDTDDYDFDRYEVAGDESDGYEPDRDAFDRAGDADNLNNAPSAYSPESSAGVVSKTPRHQPKSDLDDKQRDRPDPARQSRRPLESAETAGDRPSAQKRPPSRPSSTPPNSWPSARGGAEPTDDHDPDDYIPKVYGSEQYDEPSLWDYEPAKQDASGSVPAERHPPNILRRSPAAADALNRENWEEDLPTSGDRTASP